MSYSLIDPIILNWVQKHSLHLYTRYQDDDVRSVYTSSAQGECFQIWITPPHNDQVTVHVADIETRNDEKMRRDWNTSISQLEAILEEAYRTVKEWMDRYP